MRPVDARYPVNQEFGSYATAGVNPNQYGTEVEQLVYEYGNYQPFGHAGCDIACPIGTPVYAIADGTVLWADWGTNLPGDDSDAGYRQRWYLYKTFPGIVTLIQHDGWISIYAHMSEAPLNPGDHVTEGQQIGLSGNTRSPGVSLGAHLHVGALVDLNYPSGNGLIYGCTDPEPYFGGLAAMGATTTPLSQEDLVPNATDPVFTSKDGSTVSLQDILNSIDAKIEATQASVAGFHAADVDFRGEFDLIRARFANLPAAVLNQSFKLADGTVTNLAGILTAIHAQPVSGGTVADPQAVVRALANQLNK